jgi:hypothetical protein
MTARAPTTVPNATIERNIYGILLSERDLVDSMLNRERGQDFAARSPSALRDRQAFVLPAPLSLVGEFLGFGVPRTQYANEYWDQLMRGSLLRWVVIVLSTFVGWAGLMGSAKLATGQASPLIAPNATSGNCKIMENDAARPRCYEQSSVTIAQSNTQDGPGAVDMWRLVRTPDPIGGREAVSITRTADVSKSDLEFAGLMLRCGERSVEVLIVLVRAFPPRVHPKVQISTGSATVEFTATVVPPEVLLLLPRDATVLAAGSWQGASELAVTVEDERGPIRGVVPLAGLGHALALLKSTCPVP